MTTFNSYSYFIDKLKSFSYVLLRIVFRLCIGYLFGIFLWWILIHPYKRFFPQQIVAPKAEEIFRLSIAIIYILFLRARAVAILSLPMMLGTASQNYILVAMIVTLFGSPVANIATNAIESVRVIGCSLMMAFEQLKDRAKLILSPVIDLLSDSKQKDFESINRELSNIEKTISDLHREASSNLRLPNERVMGEQSVVQVPKVGVIADDLSKRINTSFELTHDIASKTRDLIKDAKISFDREKMGLKASFDAAKFKKLANLSKTDSGSEMNMTQIMFINCLGILKRAKDSCQLGIEDIRHKCEETIGSFLAFLWCSPIAMTARNLCPWIMDQIIDEKGSCEKLRDSMNKLESNSTLKDGKQDFSSAYRNMTQQAMDTLDVDDDDGNQEYKNKQSHETSSSRRLELSISFNRQTRDLFMKIDHLIEFVSDKYELRNALITILLFLYELYTTITFVLIIRQANKYVGRYLNEIRYDNSYITGQFIKMDKEKSIKKERSVLPLTKEESMRFMRTFSCKIRTDEEKNIQKSSCTMVLLFLGFAASLIYLDDVFYSILISIRDHALIKFHEVGYHEFRVNVTGEGSIARIISRLTSKLSSAHKLNRISDTEVCLPDPIRTSNGFYLRFTYLMIIYVFIDQVSIYAMRLRRVTAAYFYPDKEKQRVVFLHNLILLERKSNKVSGLENESDKLDSNKKDEEEDKIFTSRDALSYIGRCVSKSWCRSCCQRLARTKKYIFEYQCI